MPARKKLLIPESEYTITAVRSSGPGGQHVNKVATAVILKFNIVNSSLPENIKTQVLASPDRRITDAGIIIIKSGASRSQLRNKETVIRRLHEFIEEAGKAPKHRVPTKPSKGAVEKRLQDKSRRSEVKAQRKKMN